jgi:hypothetical protein
MTVEPVTQHIGIAAIEQLYSAASASARVLDIGHRRLASESGGTAY